MTTESQKPLAPEVRLELLIGHLSDALADADKLISELQIRKGSKVATAELEALTDLACLNGVALRDCHAEAIAIRKLLSN